LGRLEVAQRERMTAYLSQYFGAKEIMMLFVLNLAIWRFVMWLLED
tara:strand:+ start:2811 stop:2948 length:138 start_codon:yes stop_codon:yes gene_type:complete